MVDEVPIDAESGGTFDRIKGGDHAAGAGAEVVKAPARPQAAGNLVDGARELLEGGGHGPHGVQVLLMHHLEESGGALAVELVRARVHVLAQGMTDPPRTARDSAIQAAQMLGADEHRSERIVDA